MKAKTLINTFALFAAVTYAAFGLEVVFSSYTQGGAVNLSGVLPLTSLPIAADDIRGEQSNWEERRNKRRAESSEGIPEPPEIEVHLNNGRIVTGKLVSKDEKWLMLLVDGSEVGFHRSEVVTIKKKTQVSL
ncbi:MAG: hypothetical protein Q8R76_05630 [Candidatus Omnitrophota bacterium]|nr:hypothetical protein [Candidatus Omnitrophota bacterium]